MAPIATTVESAAPTPTAPPAAKSLKTGPNSSVPSKVAGTNGTAQEEPPVVDLQSGSPEQDREGQAEELKRQVIAGLKGHATLTVPGSTDRAEDVEWAYRKTLPTTLLYDEAGLKIYDQMVEVPEYYLWKAEKTILEKHGREIALRLFGHQTEETLQMLREALSEQDFEREDKKKHEHNKDDKDVPVFDGLHFEEYRTLKEKWGDFTVGRHNGGVNSEHGLDDCGSGGSPAAGAAVVELGAGSLRKTIHLLRGLGELPGLKKQDPVRYYALDLDKSELVRTLHDLRSQLGSSTSGGQGKEEACVSDEWTILDGKVAINGLWATYDKGLEHIADGGLGDGRRVFLWLGSSIGNFERRDGAEFLKSMADKSMRAGDKMLIGIDRRNAARDIELAYNDPKGLTASFVMNGLKHADRVLGGQGVIDPARFEYHDRYNDVEGRHESYYRSLLTQLLTLPDGETVELEEGELIHVERSYKYAERETLDSLDHAGLRVVQKWTDDDERYDLWLVEKTPFHFQSTRLLTGWREQVGKGLSVQEAHNSNGSHEFDADGGSSAFSVGGPPKPHEAWGSWGMPSLDEWESSWRSWDVITLTMISRRMLHVKPIDLRHICLFYLGHIPAFVDILLLKVLPDLEPLDAYYNKIFERGIDPHVDDPTQCHSHSEVPQSEEDWPKVEEILAYREKVMDRLVGIYADFASGKRTLNRHVARCIKMVQEHIDLHQETLLYMLAQSDETLPPVGFSQPDWASLTRQWEKEDARQGGEEERNALVNFKADTVVIGHDDDDRRDTDFETKAPSKDVRALNAQLGNPEFGWDNEQPARKEQTKAFSITASPVTNEQYLRFVAATGYQEQDVPPSWIKATGTGSKSSHDYNVRTIYGPVPLATVARLWPVTGSGAQLRRYAAWAGGRLPTHAELRRFLDSATSPNCVDRPGSNVGFRYWHPVPAALPTNITAKGGANSLGLPGHNGGVWEWTCTAFSAHEGFVPSILYPGYSADFHDGRHDVVLGGSWASTPCVAGRKTVCNAYQRDYPYAFIGGRVVFDDETTRKGVAQAYGAGRRKSSSPPAAAGLRKDA
ncbi:DUF323-domain-containing protein [Jaminaea rosea]|uniref:DUF323-domain-containing protein n=1 Tax=Jaminaea rosea TaxID=1569628 RepID=A0A316V1J9_9BASI|nr:DUF323-domain-containing protein [Jaminaea rosea]PWN31134.1 DUF323-domain-containing protein [Jaminaea rosea]